MNYVIRGTLLVALALIVTGCAGARSGANDFKAEVVEPAPDAGFIEHPERQTTHGDLPFQKVWMYGLESISGTHRVPGEHPTHA